MNNKNNFLLRDHKAENKMIQRLAKREREGQNENKMIQRLAERERERQKEKEMERKKGRVACRHGTDMDIYLAFEESYLLMETHTHTQKGGRKEYIINNSRHLAISTLGLFCRKKGKRKGKEREKEGM